MVAHSYNEQVLDKKFLLIAVTRMDGLMTCCFTTFSTVFQSYQDDECVIMKGCVQWNPVLQLKGSFPRMGSTLQPLYYYCLTYGDTRAPSSDWKLWNYEKEGANEKGNIKRQ